jgi:hypothetical protein
MNIAPNLRDGLKNLQDKYVLGARDDTATITGKEGQTSCHGKITTFPLGMNKLFFYLIMEDEHSSVSSPNTNALRPSTTLHS